MFAGLGVALLRRSLHLRISTHPSLDPAEHGLLGRGVIRIQAQQMLGGGENPGALALGVGVGVAAVSRHPSTDEIGLPRRHAEPAGDLWVVVSLLQEPPYLV